MEKIYNNLKSKKMTPKRKEALAAAIEGLDARLKNEELSRDDLISCIDQYCLCFNELDCSDIDDYSYEELLEVYKTVMLLYIDDEGRTHRTETPYTINKSPFCCGKPLEKIEGGFLKCSACLNKYEMVNK